MPADAAPAASPVNGRSVRGWRGGDLRRSNLSAIAHQVMTEPGVSRSQVAHDLGMSQATASNLTGELIGLGLIRELPHRVRNKGRPRVPLTIDERHKLVLGVHLGPRTAGVALVGLDGTEHASVVVPHAGASPERTLDLVVTATEKLRTECGLWGTVVGTGIATGGFVDRTRATIVEHPGAGWRNVDLLALVNDRLPSPVVVDHNARAAAQWELLYGYGRHTGDFVLMVITSDVGSVTVHDGVIRPGHRQCGGQIDHLHVTSEPIPCPCGRTGCLKAAASDDSVIRLAQEAGFGIDQGVDDVTRHARAGDETARRLLQERAHRVGSGAATLMDIIDPEYLVIAGTLPEIPEYADDVRTGASERSSAGSAAADRIVFSSSNEMSLTLFAASSIVAAVLHDPVSMLTDTDAGQGTPDGTTQPSGGA